MYAPSEEHLRVWRKLMSRLTGDLAMQVRYSRLAIRQSPVEGSDAEQEGDDAAYYALRAWAAEQLLEVLRQVPEPELASSTAATYTTPRESDAQWLEPATSLALPKVVVGGIPFQRKVCDAGMDGECWGIGCPQRDPQTRQNFCPLPTGNPWMALREGDS